MSDAQAVIKSTSPNLEKIYVEGISFDKFVFEANNLEIFYLNDSKLKF